MKGNRKGRTILFTAVATLIFGIVPLPSSSRDSFPAVQVYERMSPSVVLIVSKFEKKASLIGAGSIIDGEGTVITCAHVVFDPERSEPASDIQVFLKPENLSGDLRRDVSRRRKAKILSFDPGLDLALVGIQEYSEKVEWIRFADPAQVRVGEEVVAIGHPEQGGLWSLTYGRISGEVAGQGNVLGKDVFQTDTSLNRGNSGGPLLDRYGCMVGVNANVARVGAGNFPITGVNFAIKSSIVRKWMEKAGYHVDSHKELTRTDGAEIAENRGSGTIPSKSEAKGDSLKGGGILTPIRPYRYDEVLSVVEKEMEDLMEEMKQKIRK